MATLSNVWKTFKARTSNCSTRHHQCGHRQDYLRMYMDMLLTTLRNFRVVTRNDCQHVIAWSDQTEWQPPGSLLLR